MHPHQNAQCRVPMQWGGNVGKAPVHPRRVILRRFCGVSLERRSCRSVAQRIVYGPMWHLKLLSGPAFAAALSIAAASVIIPAFDYRSQAEESSEQLAGPLHPQHLSGRYCARPGFRPSPTVHGIANHSDHAPIMDSAPTVKPAKPFRLARMTFSIGIPSTWRPAHLRFRRRINASAPVASSESVIGSGMAMNPLFRPESNEMTVSPRPNRSCSSTMLPSIRA